MNDAKDEKHKICAVGTTVVRTLESCVTTKGRLTEFEGWTNKFIFPPYDFSVPDAFISNFHLPYSTLLMMVAALGMNTSWKRIIRRLRKNIVLVLMAMPCLSFKI